MIGAGAGGAGTTSADFTGGNYAAIANTPFGATPAAAGGVNGSNGFKYGQMPLLFGGSGGGASNTVAGGNGGSASGIPGAGGGGGGGGVTTGGAGGNGGPGQIIITCW
jgi:hypothetical protein